MRRSMIRTHPIFVALVWGWILSSPAHAQLKPEQQTGSIIPAKPAALAAKEVAEVRKRFAQCVYARARPKAQALLASSDIATVDMQASGIQDIQRELDMEECLGDQFRLDDMAMALTLGPDVLRDLLAEEFYLARNKSAPSLASNATPLEFKPAASNRNPQTALALMTFSDCTVRRDVAGVDALLRTAPRTPQERQAAAALAPALGSCLVAGQQLVLKPANIRALMAYAMWARFGR